MFPRSASAKGVGSSSRTTAAAVQQECQSTDAKYQFKPASVVQGIVFHVLDEGMAREVSGDSVKRTLDRLETRRICPSIERTKWAGMSNRQRMQWLMKESATAASVIVGKVAVLSPAT